MEGLRGLLARFGAGCFLVGAAAVPVVWGIAREPITLTLIGVPPFASVWWDRPIAFLPLYGLPVAAAGAAVAFRALGEDRPDDLRLRPVALGAGAFGAAAAAALLALAKLGQGVLLEAEILLAFGAVAAWYGRRHRPLAVVRQEVEHFRG